MDSKYLNLIIKELSGEISAQEREELQMWIPANLESYNEIKELWNHAEQPTPVFSTSKSWEKMKIRIEKDQNKKQVRRRWLYVAGAASIVMILSFVFLLQYFQSSTSKQYTAGNKIEIFYLPDSSIIWLNKNSSLILDEGFNESERNVRLEGEAFFQIAHNSEKPFFVYSGNTITKVVGTAFNIEAYKGKDVRITVESGIVEFYNPSLPLDKLVLTASHKAIAHREGYLELISDSESDHILSVEEGYTDWKDNKDQISEKHILLSELSNPGMYLYTHYDWKPNLVRQAVVEGTIYNSAIYTSYGKVRLKAVYYTNDKKRMGVEFYEISDNLTPGDSVQYKFKLRNWFRDANQVDIEVEAAQPLK